MLEPLAWAAGLDPGAIPIFTGQGCLGQQLWAGQEGWRV